MFILVGRTCKIFRAKVAFVRALSGVRVHVLPVSQFEGEAFDWIANAAHERKFFNGGVHSQHVPLHLTVNNLFSAFLACVHLVKAIVMHPVIVPALVLVPTFFALNVEISMKVLKMVFVVNFKDSFATLLTNDFLLPLQIWPVFHMDSGMALHHSLVHKALRAIRASNWSVFHRHMVAKMKNKSCFG